MTDVKLDKVTELHSVAEDIIERVMQCLHDENYEEIWTLLSDLHPADTADLLEGLSNEDRQHLFRVSQYKIDPEVLRYIDDAVREEFVQSADKSDIAASVGELDTDDAIDFIESLSEPEQKDILKEIPKEKRTYLEEGLTYPEDSAGRIMQREVVAIPSYWTVGKTIDYMRIEEKLPSDFYDIYIVNPKFHPIGAIPLSRIIRNNRDIKIEQLVLEDLKTVPVNMDQEDVAYLFRQYGLASAPVVNDGGRLLGVVTVDDIVNIIEEEREEDFMRLGGVTETGLYDAALKTSKSRFSWLFINLITAVVASIVIGFFEQTIEKLVALAILMPIVASMGGNTGTQALTVVIRALATKDLTKTASKRVIKKEMIVGALNGVLFALLMSVVATLWFGQFFIGLMIFFSMVITLTIAGLTGALIPIVLERLNIDPAIASGVILTTVTDVVGFLSFLGLATLFIL